MKTERNSEQVGSNLKSLVIEFKLLPKILFASEVLFDTATIKQPIFLPHKDGLNADKLETKHYKPATKKTMCILRHCAHSILRRTRQTK